MACVSLAFAPGRARHGAAVLVACCGVLVVSTPAGAFRTAADVEDFRGTPRVIWQSGEPTFFLQDDAPADLPLIEAEAALEQAMATWNAVECSTVQLAYRGLTEEPAAYADGVNTVQWLTPWPHPADAPGLTDVQYAQDGDGQWRIVEADVYLNAEHFTWGAAPDAVDLQSVLTHELGHALGLRHPCGEDGAPACETHTAFADVTMYPGYAVGQKTLAADDEAGVCYLYPLESCSGGTCDAECTADTCAEKVDDAALTETSICDGPACAHGQECERDADCPFPLSCRDGACAAGEAEPGDFCTSSDECATLACTEDGYCADACSEALTCAEEAARCADTLDTGSVCVGLRREIGRKCATSDDCLGGQCIAGVTRFPECSRACGEGHAECPVGWRCDLVAGRAVCVREVERFACALTDVPAQTRRTTALSTLALLLAFGLCRRRGSRRRSTTKRARTACPQSLGGKTS